MNIDLINRRKELAWKALARYRLKMFLEATPCVNFLEYGPETVSGFSPRDLINDRSFQFHAWYPEALFVIYTPIEDQYIRQLISYFQNDEWFFLGISDILPWLKISFDTQETACLRSIIENLGSFILMPSSQKAVFGVSKREEPDRYAVLHKSLDNAQLDNAQSEASTSTKQPD